MIAGAQRHEAAEFSKGRVEQLLERPADHARGGAGPGGGTRGRFEHQLRPAVVADEAAAGVQRQQVVGVDVEELGCRAQAQHPVVPEAVEEAGVLDVPGIHLHQLQRQVLAVLGLGRAQRRDVEHRVELPERVVHRCGAAGQRDVGGVEVVALVHGDRAAIADAGAHPTGAGQLLAPVRTQVEPGAAQAGVELQVANEVDGDAAGIGEQHHITQPGHLLVERLQPVPGDVQEGLHLVLVLAQPRAGQDHRLLHARGIEPVLVHAALPGVVDHGIVREAGGGQGAAGAGHLHHGGNVLALPAVQHGGSGAGHALVSSPDRLPGLMAGGLPGHLRRMLRGGSRGEGADFPAASGCLRPGAAAHGKPLQRAG